MLNIIEAKYKAAAYIRISKEDALKELNHKEESTSIQNQRDIITEYAKKNHIVIHNYYVDDGYSGGNFNRPGFQKMIHDIECGIINCVITKDTSRLGREFIETGNYMFKYFPEHKVRYIAILENFDTIYPNGVEDIIPFKAVINDMYLKDISRKIKSVRHTLMDKGFFVGSTVPYGYKRSEEDSRKLVIDEYASGIVRKIFNMKNIGMTEVMIARYLTNNGILPPNVYMKRKIRQTITTNLWKAVSVKNILANEVYIGTLIQGKYERVSLKSKKKILLPKSQWIIKKNNHPAIVDTELFYKVNHKYVDGVKNDTRFRKYDYLLKGFVICHDCGKTMLVRKYKNRNKDREDYAIYCCRTYAVYRNHVCSMHYYREKQLNQLVLNKIRYIFSKYSSIAVLEKKYDELYLNFNALEKYQVQLNKSQLDLLNIDKTISELYKDKVDGIINIEEFRGIQSQLRKDKETIEKSIHDLKKKISNIKKNGQDGKYKLKIIQNFLDVVAFDKYLLGDLIKNISIHNDKKVTIYFNFQLDGNL